MFRFLDRCRKIEELRKRNVVLLRWVITRKSLPMARCIFLFFSLIFSGHAQMVPMKVKLLRVSKSKRTVIVDRGHLDGLEKDDFSIFLIRPDDLKDEHYYVAKGRLSSLSHNYSMWDLVEVADPLALEKGGRLVMKNQRTTFKGRVPKKMDRKKVILNSNGSRAEVKSKVDGLYQKGPNLNPKLTEGFKGGDTYTKLEDTATWEEDDDLELNALDLVLKSKSESPTRKDMSEDDLQKVVQTEEFYRINGGELKELQDPSMSLSGKYSDSMRVDDMVDFQDKAAYPSTYDQVKSHLVNNERFLKDDALLRIEDEGPGWSDYFTEAELASFVHKNGLREELEKQQEAVNSTDKINDISFTMSLPVVDSSDSENAQNKNSKNFDIGIGHEIYLGSRFPSFHHFGFKYGLVKSYSSVGLEGANGSFSELYILGTIFWYPFQSPQRVKTPMFYLGLGTKRGTGTMTLNDSGKISKYSTSSLARLFTGLKFRFSQTLGMRAQIGLSRDTLRQSDLSDSLVFPTDVSVTEIKFGVSLSTYL
jgi:hypothetical protein